MAIIHTTTCLDFLFSQFKKKVYLCIVFKDNVCLVAGTLANNRYFS